MRVSRSRRVKVFATGVLAATTLLGGVAYARAGSADVLGGPTKVTVRAKGDVRWILPGQRELDPFVFGTPAQPLGFEQPGVIGVPVEGRLLSEDGNSFTTTAAPGPFSDNWAAVTGRSRFRAVDVTALGGPGSRDKVRGSFNCTSPDGLHKYRVKLRSVLPDLPDHENFGGVGLNVAQHGRTGIGTKLMPQVLTYVTFWAVADLYHDGELVAPNQFVHYMLTDQVRDIDGDYSLGWDNDVSVGDLQAHLILPPVEVTPDGPVPRPVPTGFELPNGVEQPFMHIMFEDITKLSAK